MDTLTKLWNELTPQKAFKIAGLVLLGIIIVSLLHALFGSPVRMLKQYGGMDMPSPSAGVAYQRGMGGAGYDSVAANYAVEEKAMMPQFSMRNALTSIYPPVPPVPGSPAGDMAEAFEVTEYSASIETRRLDETCAAFDELKAREDVIFESANSYDRGCSYQFKVKHASVEEVLAWLREFDPKDLSENTYTIKRQIDDFTNEVEVLEKKRTSIDETLESALNAYDEITRLATNTQNADALAQIITAKIMLIERLTQERININEQLDRLARAKADELDRLEYTSFSVSVYENKFLDGEQLADSWKETIRQFFLDVNKIAQDLTVNLLLLILLIAQWLLYAAIVLVVGKYAWRFAKNVWRR